MVKIYEDGHFHVEFKESQYIGIFWHLLGFSFLYTLDHQVLAIMLLLTYIYVSHIVIFN